MKNMWPKTDSTGERMGVNLFKIKEVPSGDGRRCSRESLVI